MKLLKNYKFNKKNLHLLTEDIKKKILPFIKESDERQKKSWETSFTKVI